MHVHKLPHLRLLVVGMLGLTLLVAGLRPPATASVYAGEFGNSEFRNSQAIVGLNLLSGATIEDINATYGTSVISALAPATGIYLLKIPGDNALLTIEQMSSDLRLEFAEPNYIGKAPEADPSGIKSWGGFDPTPMATQYAPEMLNVAAAQALSTGKGGIVAIIDTGAQLDHPAIAANITTDGYDFIDADSNPEDVFNNLDDDGDGLIDEGTGHGTHIAGIIHLIAPDAQILSLRVLDSDGNGDFFAVATAIQYAVAHGANVINLSLGTSTRSDTLRKVIREATRAGAVVVAAAGNLSTDEPQFPAADPCAIGVTSIGATSVISPFANYGAWVDIAAPGEAIYSSYPPSGYAWWSGTSMATPFISGQAALIHSLRPDLNARDILTVIGESSRSLKRANLKLDGLLGEGQADIGASLAMVASGNLPIVGGYMSSSCITP